MSDQEVAFDDWEAEAEAVAETIENQPEADTKEKVESEVVEETKPEVKEKVEVVDPHKVLLAKIEKYKDISDEKYESFFEAAKEESTTEQTKVSNQILKNDKDFAQFAKAVAKKFNDQATEKDADALEENNLLSFVEETLLLLYNKLEWKNMQATKEKLRVVKKDRKDEEAKAKKQKEKEERLKRQQKAQEAEDAQKKENKVEPKPEDDIFGGATLVNSKQEEDERKNKEIKKVEVAPKVDEEEDDDFM